MTLAAPVQPSPVRLFLSTHPPSRELAGRMRQLRPNLPRGARVLFGGTIPYRAAYLTFLTRAAYADPTLQVSFRDGLDEADAVFVFDDGCLMGGQPAQRVH